MVSRALQNPRTPLEGAFPPGSCSFYAAGEWKERLPYQVPTLCELTSNQPNGVIRSSFSLCESPRPVPTPRQADGSGVRRAPALQPELSILPVAGAHQPVSSPLPSVPPVQGSSTQPTSSSQFQSNLVSTASANSIAPDFDCDDTKRRLSPFKAFRDQLHDSPVDRFLHLVESPHPAADLTCPDPRLSLASSRRLPVVAPFTRPN